MSLPMEGSPPSSLVSVAPDRQAAIRPSPRARRRDRCFRHWRASRSSTPRPRRRDRASLRADRGEPRQRAVRPQRRAVLDEGVVPVKVQRRVRRDRADLPAREFDRAVEGQLHRAAQDSRGPETRAARGHVEERLVGAGAGQIDPARIIDRRRRHLVRRHRKKVAVGRAPPLRSSSIRRGRGRRRREGRFRHWRARRSSTPRPRFRGRTSLRR